jgi:hypothetical protein
VKVGLLITRQMDCRGMADWLLIQTQPDQGGSIMAKRKKGSKVQSRAKLRRRNPAKRGKARKVAQAKTVAKPKPKRTPVKKAAQKEAVAPAVETLVDTTEIREEGEPKPPSLI